MYLINSVHVHPLEKHEIKSKVSWCITETKWISDIYNLIWLILQSQWDYKVSDGDLRTELRVTKNLVSTPDQFARHICPLGTFWGGWSVHFRLYLASVLLYFNWTNQLQRGSRYEGEGGLVPCVSSSSSLIGQFFLLRNRKRLEGSIPCPAPDSSSPVSKWRSELWLLLFVNTRRPEASP